MPSNAEIRARIIAPKRNWFVARWVDVGRRIDGKKPSCEPFENAWRMEAAREIRKVRKEGWPTKPKPAPEPEFDKHSAYAENVRNELYYGPEVARQLRDMR